MDVLLCGLAFTSRTETLEDYLKPRVKSLAVIAVSSCFLKENLSICRYYEQGELKRQWRIPNFLLSDYRAFRQPLVMLVFIVNLFSIGFTVLKLRRRFDL